MRNVSTPPRNPTLNRASPLAVGLQLLLPSIASRDLVVGNVPTTSGSVKRIFDPLAGEMAYYDGSGSQWTEFSGNTLLNEANTEFTMSFWEASDPIQPSFAYRVGQILSSHDYGIGCLQNAGNSTQGMVVVRFGGGESMVYADMYASTPGLIVVRYNAAWSTRIRAYRNGVELTTLADNGAASIMGTSGIPLQIGRGQSDPSLDFKGYIGHFAYWRRAISDHETFMLYDPATRWDLYERPTGRSYLFGQSITFQYGRPTSDVAAGGWTPSTGSDLYAMVDETVADDADRIRSNTGASSDAATLGIAPMTTPDAGPARVVIRHRTGS